MIKQRFLFSHLQNLRLLVSGRAEGLQGEKVFLKATYLPFVFGLANRGNKPFPKGQKAQLALVLKKLFARWFFIVLLRFPLLVPSPRNRSTLYWENILNYYFLNFKNMGDSWVSLREATATQNLITGARPSVLYVWGPSSLAVFIYIVAV